MILILSSENDHSTKEVGLWLTSFKEKHKVIYAKDLLGTLHIKPFNRPNAVAYLEEKIQCQLTDIKRIWCRKWNLNEVIPEVNVINGDPTLNLILRKKSIEELEVYNKFLFNLFPQDKMINNFFNEKYAKPNQLLKASECGLKIPETFFTQKKEALHATKNELITKSIDNALHFTHELNNYACFTALVDPNEADIAAFAPSFFQEKIEKKFEIRTFVLGNRTFSSAIFSQNNAQTAIDYRRYDRINPNLKAAFELPKDVEDKILSLFQKLEIKTGSVDLIVNTDNEYVFLEVNPFGQFGMVSKPHNYALEMHLANYLIHGKN